MKDRFAVGTRSAVSAPPAQQCSLQTEERKQEIGGGHAQPRTSRLGKLSQAGPAGSVQPCTGDLAPLQVHYLGPGCPAQLSLEMMQPLPRPGRNPQRP